MIRRFLALFVALVAIPAFTQPQPLPDTPVFRPANDTVQEPQNKAVDLRSSTDLIDPNLFKGLAKDSRFFELRTYHAAPGKLEALNTRFRDHTNKLFANHGMEVIAFWVPMTKEGKYENTLIYILAFPNRQAHDDAWKAFSADPEWQAAKAESEKDGKLVQKVDSVFMTATDFSPIK